MAMLEKYQMYIGGEWRASGDGKTRPVLNPATGAPVAPWPAISLARALSSLSRYLATKSISGWPMKHCSGPNPTGKSETRKPLIMQAVVSLLVRQTGGLNLGFGGYSLLSRARKVQERSG